MTKTAPIQIGSLDQVRRADFRRADAVMEPALNSDEQKLVDAMYADFRSGARHDLIWYPRFFRDWKATTRTLSAEEEGIYSRLVDSLYEHSGFLEDENRNNGHECRVSTRKFGQIKNKLIAKGKLVEIDGFITNVRVLVELKKQAEKRAKNSENAKKKWEKNRGNSEQIAENCETDDATAYAKDMQRARVIHNSEEEEEETLSNQQTQSPSSSQKNTESQSARESLFEDLPVDDCGQMGFCGDVVRLKPSDVDDLRKNFSTIPDILAFIRQFDTAMAGRKRRGQTYDDWKAWLEKNLYREHADRLDRKVEAENVETYFDHETGKRQRVNRG